METYKVKTCPACFGTGMAPEAKSNENLGSLWSLHCNVCFGMGSIRVPVEQPPVCNHRTENTAPASSYCA